MSPAPSDLAPLIGPVALALWGEPNKAMSSKTELRFGKHGSKSVDLKTGVFFDHEAGEGGGVLALLERETGCSNGEAFDWLHEHGFEVGGGEAEQPFSRNGELASSRAPRGKIVATYDYVDEAGELLYQVVRLEPKTFRQRRPDGKGGWTWSVKGAHLVPYRLPELLEAIGADRLVFIVEGEKDVENLAAAGVPATCNPMGAGKWPAGFGEHFRGADVVILPDNDDAGRAHRDLVAVSLHPVAARVRALDLPELPPKGDVSDWLGAGGTVERLYDLVDSHARPWSPDGAAASRFGAVWWRELDQRLEEPEWLVDDLLTRGDVSMIYGPSQSGKSFFATDLSLALARGVDVLERKVLRPAGVVYIAAEGKKGFKLRLRAYRQHFELAATDDLPFVLLPTAVDLYGSDKAKDGDTSALIEEIKAIAAQMRVPLGLVVVDTLAATTPGANENASEDMSRIMRHVQRIQEQCHVAVMIVHHKNAAGDKPRGHTSLFAGVDNAIEVTRDPESGARTAKIIKLKDGEDGQTIGFRLQSIQIGTRDDGKPITSCVVVPAQAGSGSTGDRGRRPSLPDQAKIALQALRDALIDHGEPAPGMLQLPYGVRVVRAGAWKERFLRSGFEEPPTDEAFRQAFKRAGDKLHAQGIIGRDQPYVWIAREPSQ